MISEVRSRQGRRCESPRRRSRCSRSRQIVGKTVFVVEDDALIACFDEEVGVDLARAIAKREPLRAVFRDSAFGSDAARVNAEQIFREISPSTDVKTI